MRPLYMWKSILLLSFVIQHVSSHCPSNGSAGDTDSGHFNASLVCAKLFPALHACNFEDSYPIPEWEDYYPIIPIPVPVPVILSKNVTCLKYVGGYASDTPVLCVCSGGNCDSEDELLSALRNIEQESVNGKLFNDKAMRKIGNCIIKRIILSKPEDDESSGRIPDIQMDPNHPLLSWYKRIINDDTTRKARVDNEFKVDFVLLLVLIYILAVTSVYALLLWFRIRKLRPCVITQSSQ
ncbi:hypothetical protein Y032_0297g1733 [Ancylostoma ceylanicum]|nr:hypothetical protein Y032_0297g1733 [Ancylostoma ceylanicum]